MIEDARCEILDLKTEESLLLNLASNISNLEYVLDQEKERQYEVIRQYSYHSQCGV